MTDVLHKYKGPGRVFGLPARDLTEADIAAMNPLMRRKVTESGLYTPVAKNTERKSQDTQRNKDKNKEAAK